MARSPKTNLPPGAGTSVSAVRELVGVPAVGSPALVDALVELWEAGDAVLPLDPRLPPPMLDALLERLRPTLVLDADGARVRRQDGRPVEPGDALVMPTSGSTGEPKGVVLTHDGVRAASVATSARLGIDADHDRWLACLPLAHVGGMGVVTRALHTGTPLDVLDRADPAEVTAAGERGCTRTALVPTVLRRADVSAFRTVLLGGTAPPDEVPSNVVSTYGMTETGGGIVYDGWPLDGVELRTVQERILVRGPMLLRAYRGPHADRSPLDAEGWFDTGDAGTVGDDGHVEVHGRIGEMIVSGGENVWPAAVEAVLAAHPGVAEVAVVGRPDPEWGEVVTAVVAPAAGATPPSLDELRDVAKATLPAFAAPKRLELVARLPRSAIGKIRRAELRAG